MSKPRRILIEAAAEQGWVVSFGGDADSPIAAGLSDDWDLVTYLAKRLDLPMPAVQERPVEADSNVRALPRIFGRGK